MSLQRSAWGAHTGAPVRGPLGWAAWAAAALHLTFSPAGTDTTQLRQPL